jgi:hypothetical protein
MRIGFCCASDPYLAGIKRAPHGDVVYVRVRYGCHLSLLYGRDSALGMQDEDGNIFFPLKP